MRRILQPLLALLCAFFLRSDAPEPAGRKAAPAPPLPKEVVGDTCETTQAPLTAITWNVAMAPGMNPLYRPRQALLADAIRSTPFDLLCVQEAWLAEDKRVIAEASGLPERNVFSIDTTGLAEDEEDGCDTSEIEGVLDCAKKECANGPPEDTTLCALGQCKMALGLLFLHDRHCMNCLAAMVGRSADDITKVCAEGSASRIYDGQNGVMLLSRWPLYDREVVFLPSSNANRPALLARVHVPGVPEPLEVACTHISSPQSIPPSHSGYPDWLAEQRAQTHVLLDRLAQRAGTRPTLFLGDANFGAARGTEIGDYYRPAYDDVIAAGYYDPAGETDPPICSVCGDNNVRGAPGPPGFLFDHVFFRDPAGGATLLPLCADRLLDRPVAAVGFDGSPIETDLSDHYAIRVKFGFR
jgi:endonuclease/exonuclease/phosphatase family metal-dependent hydrolase